MRDGYRSHRLWALGCYRPREAGARALSRPITLAWDQAVVTARLILHFNLARRFHESHTPTAVVPFLEYVEMRSGVDCDRNKEGLPPPRYTLFHTAPYLCVVDLDGTGTALHPCSNCRARSALESNVRCVGPLLLRSTRAPVEVFTSFRRGDYNERRKLHTPSPAACLSRNVRMQVRTFVAAVTKRAKQKGSAVFARQELMQIANDLCLAIVDFESFLDVLRQVSQPL